MHNRQAIREAVGAMLLGLPTTGANVFQTRAYDFNQKSLPALAIYTTTETSERDSFQYTGDGLERVLTIVIEGYAAAKSDTDDILDDIAEEVEVAMAADYFIGDLVRSSHLLSTEISITGEGSNIAGVVTLTYEASYRTLRSDPTASIN